MTTAVQVFERDKFVLHGTPKPVATIAKARYRQFRNVKNDYGTGTISIQLTDTAAIAAVQPGRLLKFVRNGVTRGCVLIGERRYDTIQVGEEAEQVLVIEGPGALAVLNDGKVQPYRGGGGLPWAKQIHWDWSNAHLDFAALGAVPATELWRQGDPADLSASTFIEVVRDQGRFAFGSPEGWVDADAMWIWSADYLGSPGSGGSGTLRMTPGVSYFEVLFTLADDAMCRADGACDDFLEFAIDGVKLFSTSPSPEEAWSRTRQEPVFVSAGTHVVRIMAEGFTRAFTDGNISALIAAVLEINAVNGSVSSVLTHTDDTWSALHLPATPPGFTAGDILGITLDEIQAAPIPALLDVNPTFSATLDSDGNAFPILTDIVTNVGDGFGEVLRQLDPWIDFRLNADMTLDVWVKDTHGTDTGKVYTPGVNIRSLELEGDTTPVSSLLVVCADAAPFVLGDASSGKQEFYDAGQLTKEAATVAGQAELDRLAEARYAITLEVTDGPFDDFDILDTVVAPDPDGDPARIECVAISFAEYEDNEVERLHAEFGDLVLDLEDKRARDLARLTAGTVSGSTLAVGADAVAKPSPLSQGGGSFAQVAATREIDYTRTTSDTNTVSQAKMVGAGATISEFAVVFDGAQAGSVDVVLKVNATTVATLTVPAGDTLGQFAGIGFAISKYTDLLTITCTDVGFGFVATVLVS